MDSRLRLHELGYYELIEKPSAEQLSDYYEKKYYQESKSSTYQRVYDSLELKFINDKLTQRYQVVKDIGGAPEYHTFLDVGCGEGFGLSFFKQQGFSVKGLDFSGAGVELHNPDCRDFLETGDLFKLLEHEISTGSVYDVVWLQNVLEHVLDPIALLVSLRRLVSRVGVLVVTVPNDFSRLQKHAFESKIVDRAFWIAIPDHVSYFGVNGLRNIATETGWNAVDILSDFPVDWFLFNAGSNYVTNPAMGKEAHRAKLQLESLISEEDVGRVNQFYRALAGIEMGRNITAFLRQ